MINPITRHFFYNIAETEKYVIAEV